MKWPPPPRRSVRYPARSKGDILAAAVLVLTIPSCNRARTGQLGPLAVTETSQQSEAAPATVADPPNPTAVEPAEGQLATVEQSPAPPSSAPTPNATPEVAEPPPKPPETTHITFGATKARRERRKKRPESYRRPPPRVYGELDTDIVRRVISARMRQNGRRCYARLLKHNPKFRGYAKVWFAIDNRGAITDVKLTESSNSFKENDKGEVMSNCLIEAIRTWTFPKPRDGGRVLVETLIPIPSDFERRQQKQGKSSW